ncbi:class I SAM-dependent methyltransferase [Balneola sp. MJW-20]|uniref:class I SAM-dependent DNA methyltransferase n=1 Tax=Gracilimonas aurantiaca TaxID=3234185 RepID=UPI0034654B54
MSHKTSNYSSLAPLYDKLMEDVDYDTWADFIDELIQIHHPDPQKVHEMACGTGTMLVSMGNLQCYDLSASDLSAEMVELARQKIRDHNWNISVEQEGFTDLNKNNTYDVIYTVFDSINYLHTPDEISEMLDRTFRALMNEGLLIFDFSTPQNSLEAVDYLNNEEGSFNGFRYFRSSRYDVKAKFHYNEFDIEELANDGVRVVKRSREVHKQKIYSFSEMKEIINRSAYNIIAAYEDFDTIPATDKSSRVTMVLKCQKQQ